MAHRSRARFALTAWRDSAVARFIVAHPAMQPFVFAALVSIYIWWVAPAAGMVPQAMCLAVLGSLPLASNLVHRDGWRDIGLRLDNLPRSALAVGGASAAMAFLVATGLMVATLAGTAGRFSLPSAVAILTGPLWSFVQQYVLQGFVRRRLRAACGPRTAAAVAALLFGSLHAPNPVLVPATTLAGYVWCRLHERAPNLFTLALSHAGLAVLVLAVFPAAWHHGLRVGPGYRTWP